MILAELTGIVALIEQKLRDRRRARPQPGRAAGQLRRNHSCAQRMHAGEEGVAPGGAALLGIICHEERAVIADAIDIRRLADHQTAMINTRLHDADVVAHDEDDVGLAGGRLCRCRKIYCGKLDCRQRGRNQQPTYSFTYLHDFSSLYYTTRATRRQQNVVGARTGPVRISLLYRCADLRELPCARYAASAESTIKPF